MSGRQAIRLVAIPLTRPNHEKYGLVYLYAQRTPLASVETIAAHKPWVNRITDFGAKQWLKMGSAPMGNWKFKVYTTGEGFMDRIPFEEWALKSIEPALVPSPVKSLKSFGTTGQARRDKDAKGANDQRVRQPESYLAWPAFPHNSCKHQTGHIELLYPGLLGPPDRLVAWLGRTMAERQPYHRKWMRYNMLISPLTLPFAVVPIVPNLPFFYLMWRAWSHWRAYRAAKYLNAMIRNGLVIPRQSKILDMIYDGVDNDKGRENRLLLTREMLTRLKDEFQWPAGSQRELERATDQAKLRLSTEQTKL